MRKPLLLLVMLGAFAAGVPNAEAGERRGAGHGVHGQRHQQLRPPERLRLPEVRNHRVRHGASKSRRHVVLPPRRHHLHHRHHRRPAWHHGIHPRAKAHRRHVHHGGHHRGLLRPPHPGHHIRRHHRRPHRPDLRERHVIHLALPLGTIVSRLWEHDYGPVTHARLHGRHYVLRTYDRFGRPVALTVDARTGHVLRRRLTD